MSQQLLRLNVASQGTTVTTHTRACLDKGGRALQPICLALILILLLHLPSWSQEATAVGLKGHVHTVHTEEFIDENGVSHQSRGSTFEVYDRQGYQLEVYRYKPDGSLWVRTIMSRNGRADIQIANDGHRSLREFFYPRRFRRGWQGHRNRHIQCRWSSHQKSTNEFLEKGPESTTYRSRDSNADGSENTREVIDSTDPKTGITHQTATMNGKPETDWVIQRDGKGVPEKDKIVLADGSYNERERMQDGTTVEDRYSASTKSHTYQTSDARGHLTEVTSKSDSSYIRCTYSFDKTGRPTGQINYDASGKILDKSTIEYQDDSSGNWTEEKIIVWDTMSEPIKQKIVVTSLRTINYY